MLKKTTFAFLIFGSMFFGCQSNSVDAEDPQYGTGLKQNTEASLEKVEEADIEEDLYPLPPSFFLNGPPIINQGETSKCVAFSGGYYITSMYNGVTSKDLAKSGSPEFLYAQYKKINKLTDCSDGCYLFDEDSQGETGAAEVLLQYGTTSWNQLPFIDKNSCALITSTLISQATSNKIKDYYRLDKSEYTDVIELKTWLYYGYPLWFGIEIDEGFMDMGATDVWSKPIGKSEGSHAMVIVGYDDNKKAFKIANSWGTDWGDKGFGWVDYNYFIKLLKADGAPEIGILVPNETQRINMSKVSPATCGNAGWGDLVVVNTRNQEVAVEITGTNYTNTNADNIDAKESQFFGGIPKGTFKVKILTSNKSTLIKEYNITITQCQELVLNAN